ncbi:MAG: type II toxin-antitoxin system HicA family toxin [Lachnospiraceae bacterium]|jgi:mRNA interferase HicA|nr:type II toxin-antitoxin system HicA family toxin [Lachnospiraceae bacterium]
MPMTPREMIKHLKQNGFTEVSQNGSHVKLKNESTGRHTIVPYHSKSLKRGLEQEILKQAGLK